MDRPRIAEVFGTRPARTIGVTLNRLDQIDTVITSRTDFRDACACNRRSFSMFLSHRTLFPTTLYDSISQKGWIPGMRSARG